MYKDSLIDFFESEDLKPDCLIDITWESIYYIDINTSRGEYRIFLIGKRISTPKMIPLTSRLLTGTARLSQFPIQDRNRG